MTGSTTGLTRDAGWNLGLRRTIPAPCPLAWAALLAELGLAEAPTGTDFTTADGTRGQVRGAEPGAKLRATWQPPGEAESTIQLRVLPAATGATLSFHQERLGSPEERERWLRHWAGVADRVAASLGV